MLYFYIKINDQVIDGTYKTADEAMKAAEKILKQDHSIKEADIYRHERVLTIVNKDYQK